MLVKSQYWIRSPRKRKQEKKRKNDRTLRKTNISFIHPTNIIYNDTINRKKRQ